MYVDSQDSHAESEPEILLSNDAKTIWIPRVRVEVVAVSEHHKYPSYSVESKSAAYVYNPKRYYSLERRPSLQDLSQRDDLEIV